MRRNPGPCNADLRPAALICGFRPIVCGLLVAVAGCGPQEARHAAPAVVPRNAVATPAASTPPTELPKPRLDPVALLFPHTPGTSWKLRMTGAASGAPVETYDVTQVALGSRPEDPAGSFRIETRRGDQAVALSDYVSDAAGVMFAGTELPAESRIEPPMPLLKLPVRPGQWRWKGEIRSKSGSIPAEAALSLSGPDETVTPGGSYMAYRIDERLTVKSPSGESVTVTSQWVAPKVGLVRQVIQEAGQSATAVLLAFNDAAPGTGETGAPGAVAPNPAGGGAEGAVGLPAGPAAGGVTREAPQPGGPTGSAGAGAVASPPAAR